jgi:ATP-binding cassette subfamily B protein
VTYQLTAARTIGVGRVRDLDDLDGVRAAAAKSGANTVIVRLPAAYETMLGKWFEEGQQLSGGEW